MEDRQNKGDDAGEMGDALRFIELGAGRSVKEFALGNFHACAVLDNDQLKCWGYGLVGSTGLETVEDKGDDPKEMGDNLPAVDLGDGLSAKKVCAGSLHTCVVLSNDRVKCFGQDAGRGILGLEATRSYGNADGDMGNGLPFLELGTGVTASEISCSETHTCIITRDTNEVKCWGDVQEFQDGVDQATFGPGDGFRGNNQNEMGNFLPSASLGSNLTVVQVAAGDFHSCVLFSNKRVKCFGWSIYGQVGTYGDYLADFPFSFEVEN